MITGQFYVLQLCDIFDFEAILFVEVRDCGEQDQKIIRATARCAGTLIDLAVENHHFAVKSFEGAEAKIAMLQKGR